MPDQALSKAQPDRRPVMWWFVWMLSACILIAIAGGIGATVPHGAALILTLETHLSAGWPALLFLLAAIGIGRAIIRLCPASVRLHVRPVGTAIGCSILLLAIMLLGTAGVLTTTSARLLMVIGIAGLGFDALASVKPLRLRPFGIPRSAPPLWLWFGLPGIAVLAVAGANPPGVLWASEYGGYDVLSYHLQLPKEWIDLGHTRPLKHNVYSFLPGVLEQAYACLGYIRGAEKNSGGLLADGGTALTAAHTLHAGLTILAAKVTARLARRLALASGANRIGCRLASSASGGLVLCTPWIVVVGSLAYNEMGVVFLGAAALLAACRRGNTERSHAFSRGLFVGGLVGAACLIKPTALLFVGGPAAVLMLRFASLRDWGRATLGATIAGCITIAPWLIRNAVMSGNPVFPLATDLLGTGHWTVEQASRFGTAHAFEGRWIDRLALLIFADPNVSEGVNAVARYRGTSNVQWLLAFPAALVGLVVCLVRSKSRAIGLGLALCLVVQLIAWLGFTHLQSRFLIPCIIVLGPATGVGLGCLIGLGRSAAPGRFAHAAVFGIMTSLCVLQASALWMIFAEQRQSQPNALLGSNPNLFMGEPYTTELGRVSPIAFVNHELPEDATIVLIGDSTPLYHSRRTIYSTVWDSAPSLPMLHNPVFVLINDAELARQQRSGYLDEQRTFEMIQEVVNRSDLVRTWPDLRVRLYRVQFTPQQPEPMP